MAEEKNRTGFQEAAQESKEPCGLIIRLEKDALWAKRIGDDPVLGYFDHIKFQQINNWLDFSPRTTAVELHDKGDKLFEDAINGSLLSMYPIKLLFPEQPVMDELNREVGLNYAKWRGDIFELLEQNPCLTVLLVNLTDEFKGELPRDLCGEQLRRFADVIRQGLFLFSDSEAEKPSPYNSDWARNANFCIMPSLGYSDYCIMLAEEDWHFAPALIEFLHRAVYTRPGSHETVPILSTDYVIPAYHTTERATQSRAHQWGIQLSMRIHLRPGTAMTDLKRAAGDGIEVYQLSGSSDCVLESRSESAFNRLLNVAASGCWNYTNSAAGKIRTLVVSTEASFLRPVSDIEPPRQGQTAEIKPSDQIKAQIKALRTVLQSYWVLLRNENCHMRQFNSMWNRVTAIENICKGPHNRSLQEIMGPWLDAFTDCLKRCVEQAAALAEQDQRDEDTLRRWLEYVDGTLDTFIEEAGSLLADLSRSDCFFMESERYNHASVSSATSLLIAYNRWQNKFVEDVLAEDPDNLCQYAFLVRSGGCDSTTTNNIFYSLEPEIIEKPGREILKESMPLVTQMSEMSLFDCGGTVLRMTHECMHYCGERQRRDRVEFIIRFTARYFGDHLAHILFNEESYPRCIIEDLREKYQLDDEDVFKAITEAWKCGLEELRARIAGWLEDKLKRCYRKECASRWHEQDYMSDSLREWMLKRLTLIFRPYRLNRGEHDYPYSKLVKFLRGEQRVVLRKFYDTCDAEIRKKKAEIVCLARDRQLVDIYLRNGEDDGTLTHAIMWALNQLLMDPVYRVEKQDAREGFQGKGLFNALGMVVFDCFSECFADVEACRRLNVSLVDYLLGFVFEDWNVSNAMPLDAPYLFRIPAVLRVCFKNELDESGAALRPETEDSLRAAVECLVRCGMSERRKNAEQLIAQTNALLKLYQPLSWIAQPLEDYMRKCDQYYHEHPHPNMQKYQDAFQRIRLLDSGNTGNVTRLFTNLVTIGAVDGVGEPRLASEADSGHTGPH